MITRKDIKEHVDNPRITHHWDFCLADGVTILEKYKNLQNIVQVQCLRSIEDGKDAFVVANLEVSSALWVCIDMPGLDFAPVFEGIEDGLVYSGEYKHLCGDNGHQSGFKVFQDESFPKDKVLIWVEGHSATVIQIYHYLEEE